MQTKKKFFLKKKKVGGKKEALKTRYKRLDKFYEHVMDYIEDTSEDDFDFDILEQKISDLKQQIDIFYKLATDKEDHYKKTQKDLKSNYDKLVAELILIKKKKPDFVSENIQKFLG